MAHVSNASFLLGTFLFVALAASGAVAQAESRPAGSSADVAAATALSKALLDLEATKDLAFTGRVFSEEDAAGGAGGVIVSVAGAAGGPPPFEGKIEIWRPSRDETVVLSKASLPAVALYAFGDRVITSVAFEDDPVDAQRLRTDLLALLDFGRLARAVSSGLLRVKSDPKTKTTTLTVDLPKAMIGYSTAAAGPVSFLVPKVIGVRGVFHLDEKKALAAISFEVTRNNPMSGLRRRAATGDLGAGSSTASPTDFEEDPDDPGLASVYELKIAAAPSERAKAEYDHLRRASSRAK